LQVLTRTHDGSVAEEKSEEGKKDKKNREVWKKKGRKMERKA
jgi:hypothetical protein